MCLSVCLSLTLTFSSNILEEGDDGEANRTHQQSSRIGDAQNENRNRPAADVMSIFGFALLLCYAEIKQSNWLEIVM